MEPNLPTSNNNPGDLRFAGQSNASQGKAGFASFPSAKEGFGALLNDLSAKMTSHPNWTLADFSNTYAPNSDGNNSARYAATLANQLKVSPAETIGKLKPRIGDFANAVAKNEGYDGSRSQDAVPQQGSPSSVANNPLVEAGTGALLGVGAIGKLLGSTPALPILGGIAGEALDPFGGGAIGAAAAEGLGAGAGALAQQGLNAATGGQQSQDQSQAPSSAAAQQFVNSISTTIPGANVIDEAQNKGIDLSQVADQSGVIPQADENGNFDKNAAVDKLWEQQNLDSNYKKAALPQFQSTANLDDIEKQAEAAIELYMVGADKDRAKKHLKQEIDAFYGDQPKDEESRIVPLDEKGQPVQEEKTARSGKSSQITAEKLEHYRKNLTSSKDWISMPMHERKAKVHLYHALKDQLNGLAKKDGIKGWEAMNKRMEGRFMLMKAIKKMPKKAQRAKGKELAKSIGVGLATAGLDRLLGGSSVGQLASGTMGYLLRQKLGKPQYKQFGSKRERETAEKRSKTRPRNLISSSAR